VTGEQHEHEYELVCTCTVIYVMRTDRKHKQPNRETHLCAARSHALLCFCCVFCLAVTVTTCSKSGEVTILSVLYFQFQSVCQWKDEKSTRVNLTLTLSSHVSHVSDIIEQFYLQARAAASIYTHMIGTAPRTGFGANGSSGASMNLHYAILSAGQP